MKTFQSDIVDDKDGETARKAEKVRKMLEARKTGRRVVGDDE